MTVRKPDLFIIGAMKSGTTYLAKVLGSHPSIFICNPEEPSYFVDPSQLRKLWPQMWDEGYWRSEEKYLRLFAEAGTAKLLGEASTNYTKLPMVSGIVDKIHAFNPNARLIYIMRDPVERTISHYWHMTRLNGEYRSMMDAVREDPQYCDVSYYAMQLKPYFERFISDQIKILTFEAMTRNPLKTLQEILAWLNLDLSIDAPVVAQPANVTPEIIERPAFLGVLQRLRWQVRLFRYIVPYVPSSIRRFGVRMATRKTDRKAVNTSDVVSYLRVIQLKQTEELTRLLGREFPEWNTLYSNNDPQ